MSLRYEDWMRQARRDLEHAQRSLQGGDYEWACFAAQQAGEKAVKAVYQKLGADAWGHSVTALLQNLPADLLPPSNLLDIARELDKFYIPPRYPNAHPGGAPMDYYTRHEAERAIEYARRVLAFCESHLV
jgi:HEPN domain-containing protein